MKRATERCESCNVSDADCPINTVVVYGASATGERSEQGYSYRVCDRCAPVVIPLQLPFEEEER